MRDRAWAVRAGIWVLGLIPAGLLVVDFLRGRLGANPIEEVMHRLGWWALAILLISLAVTPLRRITGWNRVIRYRRLIGLFAFAYATAHFLAYIVLDQWFAWGYIVEDIAKRPFILAGFSAWLLLVPLAVTSTTGWIRRLGSRWGRLHRLVYAAAALGTLHFLLASESGYERAARLRAVPGRAAGAADSPGEQEARQLEEAAYRERKRRAPRCPPLR